MEANKKEGENDKEKVTKRETKAIGSSINMILIISSEWGRVTSRLIVRIINVN